MARRKWRTQASDKKLRKARTVTYSSKDRFPETRATARRNRSKAKTWLLKDRGKARRSQARSGGKARKNQELKTKQTLPMQSLSLSQVHLSQNNAHSKPCAQQVFQKSNKSPPCSITSPKILPLVGTCTHQVEKDLKLPLKLKLPLNRCYGMSAMQEV